VHRIIKDRPKIGIHFHWNGRRGVPVTILNVNDDSALPKTIIGHDVLAINGVYPTSSTHAGRIIATAVNTVEITTIPASSDTTESSSLAPFTKIAVSPAPTEHPGISFDSTRGRCLVQVSRIFRGHPFYYHHYHKSDPSTSPSLRLHDVVLAINGVPVSKPEQAEMIWRTHPDPFRFLYVIDMHAYRQSIVQELATIFRNVRLQEPQPPTDDNDPNLDSKMQLILPDSLEIPLGIDPESQHLVFLPLDANRTMFLDYSTSNIHQIGRNVRRLYRTTIVPFLEAFRKGMEHRLRILEDVVSKAAWDHPFYHNATMTMTTTSLRCTPIVASASARSMVVTPVSEINEAEDGLDPCYGGCEVEPHIPTTVANIQVWPIEALQTRAERSET
jgi:hypothetical protein